MRTYLLPPTFLAVLLLVPVATEGQVKLKTLDDGSIVMYNDRPASRPAPPRPRAVSFDRNDLEGFIQNHSRAQSLDPDLVRAVIQVESAFYPLAVSRKGAMGLMQLMPATARDMDVMDPWDPNENLRGGTTYLRHLLDLFGGQIELALAGYNAGPDAVQRYGGIPPFDETRDYVERVLRIYRGEPDLVVESRHLPSRGRKTYLIRGADGSYTLTTDKTVNR